MFRGSNLRCSLNLVSDETKDQETDSSMSNKKRGKKHNSMDISPHFLELITKT